MRGEYAVRTVEQYVEVGIALTGEEFELLARLVDMEYVQKVLGRQHEATLSSLRSGFYAVGMKIREQAMDITWPVNTHIARAMAQPVKFPDPPKEG